MNQLHHFLSYFVLLLILACCVNAAARLRKAEHVSGSELMVYGFCFWFTITEVLLGLAVYLTNQSYNVFIEPIYALNPDLNFFGKAHLLIMTAVLIVMSVGYYRFERASSAKRRHANIAVSYGLSLLAMIAGLPWTWGYHG